jgi:dTDP-4-dehydrorhamnose reductase
VKVLVFGHNGQLAQSLRLISAATEANLISLGRDACDITSRQQVESCVADLQPDAVINTSAYTAVEAAESFPADAMALNCEAPRFLAEITSGKAIPFIHLSTDYVFDGTKVGAYEEGDETRPLNKYGLSKRAGEIAVLETNPSAVILRTSWVFSPFGQNFVRTILARAAQGETLSVVNDQIGTPTSALDLAEACLLVLKAKANGSAASGIFHYTSEGETSWHGFAEAILAATSSWRENDVVKLQGVTSDQFPTKAVRPKNSRLKSSAFLRTFNHHQPTWQESLAGTLSVLETEFSAKWRTP